MFVGVAIVDIDNTGNASTAVHTKLYADADATVGTTLVNMVFRVQGGVRRQFIGLTELAVPAAPLMADLSFGTVTEAGQAGTTSPTNGVTVRIGIKDVG